MTERTDISVDWELNPRLFIVDLPSTEVLAQDSHDTLTGLQDDEAGGEGHQFPNITESTGKDDLGGGTSAGINTTLLNGQYYFQRTASRSSGTITSTSTTQLIDSGANFTADNVARGDWVINFTDQSVSEVLVVENLTTLTIRPLTDGSDDTFTSGDLYKVWEVAVAELGGGNFIAKDDLGAIINPFFTTFGRFTLKSAASQATLSSQAALESDLSLIKTYMAMDIGDYIDIDSTSITTQLGSFVIAITEPSLGIKRFTRTA